jgi:hypothetical protein
LPGLQAVVELAEEAVEQVTLSGVVPVSVFASVLAGSGRSLRVRLGGLRRPRGSPRV